MIIRFELPDRTAFNAAMPAPIQKEERVHVNGEQYGAKAVHWQIEQDRNDAYYGHGYDRMWDQYVVLVKHHVRSGDIGTALVPEQKHVFV